jgi:hypothetical protein
MRDSAESKLREFESICKTVLAHESGDPGVQFNEKTADRKSRATVPLRQQYWLYYIYIDFSWIFWRIFQHATLSLIVTYVNALNYF